MTASSTWIVMVRDVSGSVSVTGETTIAASLIVEAETGLIVGTRLAAEKEVALAEALELALHAPPAGVRAPHPTLVVCPAGLSRDVERALDALLPAGAAPPVLEDDPVPGAEDLFDAMLGSLAGRPQPADFPEPDDWAAAIDAARAYREQAPWTRWHDDAPLEMSLETPEGPASYVCIVLGAQGIQRGLAIVPGETLPAWLGTPGATSTPPPPGSVMLMLDPIDQLPRELVDKAHRYGWPDDDDVAPLFVAMSQDGPGEPSQRELQHLCVATVAVTAHDRRGPVVVGATSATTGTVAVVGGRASFSLAPAPHETSLAPGAHAPRGAHRRGPGQAPIHAPDSAYPAGAATADTPSISELFDGFLADQRTRLSPRTVRKYESVIDLLASHLNTYGYEGLEPDERRRWEGAYEAGGDEEAFTHLFGADKITENLGGFLGYFMVHKVLAGEDLLRSAGTVTKKLAKWLAEHGYISVDDAEVAAERATDAGRDLPRAERLSRLLYEQAASAAVPPSLVDTVPDEDLVEDYLTIDRVAPGALWFEGGIGPLEVPTAVSDLATPGWSVYAVLVRLRGRWLLLEVGNVHP